ncbi:glycosyltransferase [Natronosalvus rutilus]|uniref:Glycosyltransferase n=1 Tax=Natronosalvus rutilus TaxID=2953753 RepID=A0A9E7SYA8_9EURY|nr:glycosyltransferase [Natronosalvus rutilus]UTF54883.1 glycosyltransferase [Natronosalvus rutilus]
MKYPDVSVVLPTYSRDDPSALSESIASLADQTITPTEVFIVKDGPVTDTIESIIENWRADFPTKIQTHQIERNKGLGNALRAGVTNCTHELIARMDADDISIEARIEKQLNFFMQNPDVDIVGGYIEEFTSNPNQPESKREVPTTHDAIGKMAKFRSPMNHGTVMFRRDAVLSAGNYRAVDRMEDYDLWVRMLLDGSTFANIPEVLLLVRAGEDMYGRRGGLEYAREEIRTQTEFYKRGFTPLPIYLFNMSFRTLLRLLPNKIRGKIYSSIARN